MFIYIYIYRAFCSSVDYAASFKGRGARASLWPTLVHTYIHTYIHAASCYALCCCFVFAFRVSKMCNSPDSIWFLVGELLQTDGHSKANKNISAKFSCAP
jgi:hypothetical protein